MRYGRAKFGARVGSVMSSWKAESGLERLGRYPFLLDCRDIMCTPSAKFERQALYILTRGTYLIL
jgi:hypothetical protein